MRTLFFALAVLLPSFALCSERIAVSDNSEQTALTDLVKALARAVETEDVGAYQNCFKESRRPAVRRQAAFTFVEGRCSMEVLDIHVIEIEEENASVAVRYKMGCSSAPAEFLSELKFVKEGGRWVIDRETVKSKRSSQSSFVNDFGPGEPMAAPVQRDGARWDPMNPDRNKISPNLGHLIGDIGIQEGVGCAGGKCANGRCER